jgi:RNA polymerase sigma-70 factor (ECF subfamily)
MSEALTLRSVVGSSSQTSLALASAPAAPVTQAPADPVSFAELFEREYDFVWRCLRRLGVASATVDDAAQEVFMVASRKFDDIDPGKHRSFLFGTAVRVAANHRRRSSARREQLVDDGARDACDPAPSPQECLERKQARALLDEVLDRLGDDQRAVFVLFELEGMTMAAIADVLQLPAGTVASRLRRARDHFQREVTRLRAAQGVGCV